eukprot:s5620_g3.t1
MVLEWPVVDPAFLTYLQRVFHNPGCLHAAFDDVDTCVGILRGEFPNAVDEDLQDCAAQLLVWQENSSAACKRLRRQAADSVFCRLPCAQSFTVQQSYDRLSKTSVSFVIEMSTKKKQQKYKEEPSDARAQRFNAERRKYISLLSNLIKEADLPVVQVIAALDDTGTAWQHLFAARRSGTLKNRYKSWKPFRAWIEVHRGYLFPRHVKDIIDYMQHRVNEGCGKTIPLSFDIALQLFETVGRIPDDERLSRDPLWQGHVKSWSAELAEGSQPKQTAPMYTVAMLISLELLVVEETELLYKRALAWVILVMVWGSMRCDDMQAVLPERTTLSNFGLRLVLGKSKTTGPDKQQKEIMVHVLRTVSLTGEDWLGCGYNIWESDPFKYKRDYQVMMPNRDWTGVRRKFAPPSTVSTLIGKVLSQLLVPRKRGFKWEPAGHLLLLPDGLDGFFTGHSPRNFLTSVAAVLGFTKDMRAYLGRWSIGMTASEEKGCEQYHEDEALDALCAAAGLEGANPTRIRKRHVVMNGLSGRNCLGGVYPTMTLRDDDWFLLQEADADDIQALEAQVQQLPKPVREEEPVTGYDYFVTVSRRTGHRRLHLTGCFVKPSNCCEVRLLNQITSEAFDSTCRACKKKMLDQVGKATQAEDSSSTASSSSTDGSEPEEDM